MALVPTTPMCCLSSDDKALRDENPEDYPCFTMAGLFVPASGCREKCCVVRAPTPDGEDTPKWVATLAGRQEDAEGFPQPNFGEVSADKANNVGEETPDKTVFTHNTTTGHTPCHMPGWMQLNYKINCDFPGVPGEDFDNPVCLATPKRQKTGAGSP